MMKIPSRGALSIVVLILLSHGFPAYGAPATEPIIKTETLSPRKINLIAGKSLVIDSRRSVKRVSLASPSVADAMVLTPLQVYLTGKAPGMTNLILWEGEEVAATYDVEVQPDVARLKDKLHEILPQEENIRVSYAHDTIILSGAISNAANLPRALAVAVPFGKVSNLLDVDGVQQVMLEVRVSEVQRSLMRKLGFNFSYLSADGKHLGLSLLNNLTKLPSQGAFPDNPLQVTDGINAIYRFNNDGSSWTAFIDALKEQGLITVLAEPTLTTLSGQKASFNAGGEVPIPEAGGLGTTTITFKKFGVGLNFTPTVLSDRKISLQVAPKVSEINFALGTVRDGFVIPGFTEREVSTVVELADGQSVAIAGLLSETTNDVVSKFPVLGDIPILGALFRSTSFQKNETELVVIVTPHLVKPLDMSKQTLPTDKFSDPGDLKYYLFGIMSGRPKEGSSSAALYSKGFDGEVGHIMQ